MSLKAKLEAVIYAAEEPVTLNQLAALFAADALEWKAELEASAAEQAAEVAGVSPNAIQELPLIEQVAEPAAAPDEAGDGPPMSGEATVAPEDEAPAPIPVPEAPVPEAGAPAEPEAPPSGEVVSVGEAEAYPPIVVEGEDAPPVAELAAPAIAVDAESEAKRMARQKDREVKAILRQLLDELIASYEADGRGVEIREIAGGYRMATKPECHDAVRLFVKSLKPPLKLSLPALETLAVIAYKQPVTAPEVSEIRGVEASGVLGSLLARKLIATAGRKQVIGRPILYKTTKEFLLRFGLKDVSELPSMEEFEKMAATELEMEPEVTEADKATTAAEADVPGSEEAAGGGEGTETGQENAPSDLESNLSSSLELAGTEEAAEEEAPDTGEAEPEPPAVSSEAASVSENQENPPEESGREQKIEATSDATEESNQQTAQEKG